ncbi:MAG: pantoate--beta-alanine ligase [Verrucomicrobia bacterium]|nr:pantoate--beta-alanine ligase [Verrucomicrobiota bacterium]
MRVIADIHKMQSQAGRWLRQGIRVVLVPTMGCLHAGHLSLIQRARREAGRKGVVVVSIYVNPTQFGPKEDFDRYPRDLKADLALCRKAGVSTVFAPTDQAMYPGGSKERFDTYVVAAHLSQIMEGHSRPTHFQGVTTVVAKLFNLVRPVVAVFGAKDWQQAVILKRMVADLNFPVQMIISPIVREPDGLALSSRNRYLSPGQRGQATVLWRSLQHARKRVRHGGVGAARLRSEVGQLVHEQPDARLDYVEFFDGETLVPVKTVHRGTHMALAAFVGRTRLIDNGRL